MSTRNYTSSFEIAIYLFEFQTSVIEFGPSNLNVVFIFANEDFVFLKLNFVLQFEAKRE